jgi:site-specific recombinase XerC
MTANQIVIQDYLHYLQVQRQYSAHTISNYQRDLFQLVALAVDQEPLAQLSHFDVLKK